ncbi:MAG: efflux RND transporter permease subunit [Gemmatimonadaceae bacterium]
MNGGVLNAIVRFAVRFRGIVVALAIILLVYGVVSVTHAKYDVFPEFAPPQVAVQTEAPGLASEQVELLVTQPIENAINGTPGLAQLRSSSIQGLSVVTVVFDPTTDIYRDRQLVAERLTEIGGTLPVGVAVPVMTPLTSSTSTVLVAGLTSTSRSLMDLRTVAEWTVRPRLLGVPGVANVVVFGGEQREIQIQVHPDRLIRYGLGLGDVLRAAPKATGLQGAGFIETPNQRIVLQTEGQALTPAEVAQTVIASPDGVPVRLASVADVVSAPAPRVGASTIMGHEGVSLIVEGQYGANTVEVTRGVERALADLGPTLGSQGIELHPDLFRPANFIATAIGNVRSALIVGGVLVIVVLFLFLFDLRVAAISATAIPLSLLAAVVVLQRAGLTLNTMTLGGLAIAIGEVVDDAVIDVENIVRRLRENRHLPEPRPASRVVLDASIEVRSAVVYATFAVILVFLPVLTLSGVAGRLFAPLGIAYILSVLASLVVALTVTPALAMLLLARSEFAEREPPVVRWTKDRYVRVLRRIETRPAPILFTAGALTFAALLILPFFGGSFLPELKEGHFIGHMTALPGTSLEESIRLGDRVTAALRRLSMVRMVEQEAGRAEEFTDVRGPESSEFNIDLVPLSGRAAASASDSVRRAMATIPGAVFSVNTFLTERVEETLSGYTADVVVNVFGNHLAALDGAARNVARALDQVPHATGVQVQTPPGNPQLTIRLRPAALARWGFDPVDVLAAVRAAYQGDVVGQVYDGNRVFNVTVMLDPADRGRVSGVGQLPLRNSQGTYVRLDQLADIAESSGRYEVQHVGARRVQTITANVAGGNVTGFVAEAQRRIAQQVRLPAGVYLQWSGQAEAQAQSRRDLLLDSLVAALGIVLLLSVVTRNRRNLLLVLVNAPFALVGGVFAVFASGGLLTLGSLVGFVTLFGITLRNSIMMISHFEHLVAVEGQPWGFETAIHGAADRMAPILMTSLVTALGLLPLAIGMNAPGREIEGPMALVILGGLATSMALNLLVLPTLALRFGDFRAASEA